MIMMIRRIILCGFGTDDSAAAALTREAFLSQAFGVPAQGDVHLDTGARVGLNETAHDLGLFVGGWARY
jgi:hypothetical protein